MMPNQAEGCAAAPCSPCDSGCAIPQQVAVCPECGGELRFTEDFYPEDIEPPSVECENEDDDDVCHKYWQSDWQGVLDALRAHWANDQTVPTEGAAKTL